MSETILNGEDEDVMTMLSVADDYDITREEEITLLEVEDMNIDNNNTSRTSVRQKIVFDLNDDNCDNDDNDSNHRVYGIRHKFTNERLNHSDNRSKQTLIPDSLDSVLVSNQRFSNRNSNKARNRRRFRRRLDSSQEPKSQINRFNDLREVIENNGRNNRQFNNELNLNNSIQSLDLAQNNLLNLLLLSANPLLMQNSLLNANSLLSLTQIQRNQSFNNYQQIQTPVLMPNKLLNKNIEEKEKHNLKITICNEPKPKQSSTKTSTISKIRCIINNDENSDSDDSQNDKQRTELNQINNKNGPKLEPKTKFTKHLINKVNEEKEKNAISFEEALAEVEVGVDNEYLLKMKEIDRQRLELKKRKEERRYEMADQRLETANRLQQSMKMSNKRSFNRSNPY